MHISHVLSLVSTTQTALNAFGFAGILLILWLRKGVGYRNFIFLFFSYFALQNLSAGSVATDLHRGTFSLSTAIFREMAACAGTICLGYFIWKVKAVRETLEKQGEKEKKDAVVDAARVEVRRNIVCISENLEQRATESLSHLLSVNEANGVR